MTRLVVNSGKEERRPEASRNAVRNPGTKGLRNEGTGTLDVPLRALDACRDDNAAVASVYRRVRIGPWRWWVREAWCDDLLGDGSPDFRALEDDTRATCVKEGLGRCTWRVVLGRGTVFAKVFRLDRVVDRVKARLLGNPAEREWRAAIEAERRDVPVPRPIGVGVASGRPIYAALLNEEIAGARSLADAWRGASEGDSGEPGVFDRRGLIRGVAELFAWAHGVGFFHRDAHPGNILIAPREGAAPAVRFTDLLGAKFLSGPLPRREAAEALAQLHHFFRHDLTDADRLRFFSVYMKSRAPLGPQAMRHEAFRSWVSELEHAAGRQAGRLAQQRDRRLERRGRYFAKIRLPDGWKARVALRLERRHRFLEPNVTDRTEAAWQMILPPLLTGSGRAAGREKYVRKQGVLLIRTTLPLGLRVQATCGLSAHRRRFLDGHRSRHRDVAAELVLGYAYRRRWGMVTETALILPDRDASGGPAAESREEQA